MDANDVHYRRVAPPLVGFFSSGSDADQESFEIAQLKIGKGKRIPAGPCAPRLSVRSTRDQVSRVM